MILLGTLIVLWFVRAYGIISIYAMISALLPSERRMKLTEAANGYPLRRWWLLPCGFLCSWGIVLAAINVLVRHLQ